MTDNTNFKKDAGDLLDSIRKFKRYYMDAPKLSNITAFEYELRQMLRIARTDEENKQQDKIDGMC